jgi:hypothetical protein
MFESPTITCSRRNRSASACGSSLVLMIGRDRVVADDALPDVLGPLADAVHRAARSLQHLARAADDLPGNQERDEDVRQPAELPMPAYQVVLMAAVGVARGVRVVLEQVDVACDALLAQPPVGVDQQPLQDPLARLVVRDQVEDVVALGRGIFGMAAHIEVEARPVPEEHVAAAAPGHHAPEQVARHLVGRQPPLPSEGAGNAVLVLKPEYSPIHTPRLRPVSC